MKKIKGFMAYLKLKRAYKKGIMPKNLRKLQKIAKKGGFKV